METRTHVKLYKLQLNRVTDRCESTTLVAVSPYYDHLIEWYNRQHAPKMYQDDTIYPGRTFTLTFLPDSPIKMFNPCNSLVPDTLNLYYQGVATEWVSEETLPQLRNREFVWID